MSSIGHSPVELDMPNSRDRGARQDDEWQIGDEPLVEVANPIHIRNGSVPVALKT
jgi:hypothetical protein